MITTGWMGELRQFVVKVGLSHLSIFCLVCQICDNSEIQINNELLPYFIMLFGLGNPIKLVACHSITIALSIKVLGSFFTCITSQLK